MSVPYHSRDVEFFKYQHLAPSDENLGDVVDQLSLGR
jgi:hypothetical protein